MTTLVTPTDLQSLPGAPFDPMAVDIAALSVQREAGWHIAPVITETITVESHGGRYLVLPSLRVVSVATVTHATFTGTDWVIDGTALYRSLGWPWGPYTISLTHGYDSVPVDLLPLIASRARTVARQREAGVQSVTVGQMSTSYFQNFSAASDPASAAILSYSVKVGVA